MFIIYDNRRLKFKEIASRPVREEVIEPKIVKAKTKTVYIPPRDHPWKKYPVISPTAHREAETAKAHRG